MNEILNIGIFAATIRMAAPLIFASFGGMYSERSGTWNIALEGIMLFGAFTAGAVAYSTNNLFLGLAAGISAGIFISLIHAVVTIYFQGNQIISGIAINIIGYGFPSTISSALWDTPSSTPPLERSLPDLNIPVVKDIPLIGDIISGHSILVYAAALIVIITIFVFSKTRFGLRLTACGEHPGACEASGISVYKYRILGILISGALAGLGGAYLSIGHGTQFIRNMTAGRGYIALAALIFGNWKPGRTLAACLLFGFAEALQIRLQGELPIPPVFIQMLPYLLTIFLVTGVIGKVKPPKAAGKPFVKN